MTVTILGWIWSQGTLKVDPHKLNPLQVCPPPSSVKQMRSFIRAYKAISKCIPNYSNHLGPLEDSVAGKESKEKLVWNDQLTKSFQDAQAALNTAKVITIPSSNDQLVISFDGCRTLPATGATPQVFHHSPSGSNAEDFAEVFVDNTNFELHQFLDNEEDVDPDEEVDKQTVEGDQHQRLTCNRHPLSWIRSGDFIVGENFQNMDLESS